MNVLWKCAPGCVLYILCGVLDFVRGWDHEGHGFRRLKLNNKLASENALLSSRATSCLALVNIPAPRSKPKPAQWPLVRLGLRLAPGEAGAEAGLGLLSMKTDLSKPPCL